MRVVVIGQKWLAVQLLERCIAMGLEVVGVVSAEPNEAGQPDRLELAAAGAGIPVSRAGRRVEPEQVPSCDVILAANAHCFIGAKTRARARFGALGYHPSLLPRHRGKDAITWALKMREPISGGSLYWMDDGADTGPIVAQDWCHIWPDDTPTSLWRRDLGPMGIRLFVWALERLAAGLTCGGSPQDERLATWEPSITKATLSSY